MQKTLAKVTRDAKILSQKQQMRLVSNLLKHADAKEENASEAEFDESWKKEVARRIAEYRAGRSKLIPWSDVKRELEEMRIK